MLLYMYLRSNQLPLGVSYVMIGEILLLEKKIRYHCEINNTILRFSKNPC